jgi:hypothetical protein
MAWDFETDPEFQKKLDWADDFVRREVEPARPRLPRHRRRRTIDARWSTRRSPTR